jgi:Ala-tRNA(Pro) deacylase
VGPGEITARRNELSPIARAEVEAQLMLQCLAGAAPSTHVGRSPGVTASDVVGTSGAAPPAEQTEVVMAINERLQRLFDDTRSSYAVLPHPDAYTARKVADSVRVEGWQLAKVVVIRDALGGDVMVVLPAASELDFHALRQASGRRGLQLERERELEQLFPDCEVGAMPPFGSLYGMKMYVDPCLLRAGNIFFQAGNHHEVVLMRSEDYKAIARPFYVGSCLHRDRDHGQGVAAGSPMFMSVMSEVGRF